MLGGSNWERMALCDTQRVLLQPGIMEGRWMIPNQKWFLSEDTPLSHVNYGRIDKR